MAHSSNSTKVAAAEYVKRKLEFGGPSITRSETESNQASPTLEKAKRRRLYFGESEVPVFLQCLDPVPFQWETCSGRIKFAPRQKAELETLFQKKMHPGRSEKEMLSKLFGVPKRKIETWFNNRRMKWRRQQKRSIAVNSSTTRPIAVALFPSSIPGYAVNRSAQVTPFSVPYFVSRPRSSLPAPEMLQHDPGNDPATTTTSCYELDWTADSLVNSFANQFPVPYSIAKEAPHIFGNIDDSEALGNPPTPSLDPSVEFPSILYELLQDSYASKEKDVISLGEDLTSDRSCNSRSFAGNCQSLLLQNDSSNGTSALSFKSLRQD